MTTNVMEAHTPPINPLSILVIMFLNSSQPSSSTEHPARYTLLGLEQTAESCHLPDFKFPNRCVLVLGREKEGLPPEVRDHHTKAAGVAALVLCRGWDNELHILAWAMKMMPAGKGGG